MENVLPALLLAVVIAWVLARPILRLTRRWRRYRWQPSSPKLPDIANADEQLKFVAAVEFERQPLLNKSEFRVLIVLEQVVRELQAGHRVMAQTSLGEVLRPKPTGNIESANLAFRSINSKRSDFIVVNRRGLAVLAVEYQGHGHHQGSAVQRDAVKRTVFRSAGVALIEVPPQFDAEALAQAVRGVLSVPESAEQR